MNPKTSDYMREQHAETMCGRLNTEPKQPGRAAVVLTEKRLRKLLDVGEDVRIMGVTHEISTGNVYVVLEAIGLPVKLDGASVRNMYLNELRGCVGPIYGGCCSPVTFAAARPSAPQRGFSRGKTMISALLKFFYPKKPLIRALIVADDAEGTNARIVRGDELADYVDVATLRAKRSFHGLTVGSKAPKGTEERVLHSFVNEEKRWN